MSTKRWERRSELLKAPPMEVWPFVDTSTFSAATKERYAKAEAALRMYVSGNTLKKIEEATTLQPTQVYNLIKVALEMAPDGRIYGFRAAIPYLRINEYVRTKETINHIKGTHGGLSGMLRRTLDRFPDIDEKIVALIRKDKQYRPVHELRIAPSRLHQIFLYQLRLYGVTEKEWPFNTK